MERYSFQLEVVTPLFLSGADQSRAELRVPSIKGAMRFWFRAMMGGILGDSNRHLSDLARWESQAFGDTEKASALGLRCVTLKMDEKRYGDLPKLQGLRYLAFSFREQQRKGIPERSYLAPGSILQLMARTRLGNKAQRPELLHAVGLGALWLKLFLGGIGSRSRRGFGSLHALEAPQIDGLPPFSFNSTAPQQLQGFLKDGFTQLRKAYLQVAGEQGPPWNGFTPYDILCTSGAKVMVLNQTWSSWETAMDTLGNALANFRNPTRPGARTDLGLRKYPISNRADFGLPLQGLSSGDRRSSPLLFKIVRMGGAGPSYGAVLVFFRSSFKENENRNYSLIDEFLRSLPLLAQSEGPLLEVPLP